MTVLAVMLPLATVPATLVVFYFCCWKQSRRVLLNDERDPLLHNAHFNRAPIHKTDIDLVNSSTESVLNDVKNNKT